MHRIPGHVLPVQGADGVTLTSRALAVGRVVGTTQLLEASDDILLPDLECDARSTDQLVDRLREVAQHSAVDCHELFGFAPREEAALHGADLEAFV